MQYKYFRPHIYAVIASLCCSESKDLSEFQKRKVASISFSRASEKSKTLLLETEFPRRACWNSKELWVFFGLCFREIIRWRERSPTSGHRGGFLGTKHRISCCKTCWLLPEPCSESKVRGAVLSLCSCVLGEHRRWTSGQNQSLSIWNTMFLRRIWYFRVWYLWLY